LGGSIYCTKKNKEVLVVAGKETGLDENSEKNKYMAIPRDQNAGRSHNIKINTSTFESVEQFKCLGTLKN
jgi:hypothetical protein